MSTFNPKLSIDEVQSMIQYLASPNIQKDVGTLLIAGSSGSGKSAIVLDSAKKMGVKCHTITAMDLGELDAIPSKDSQGNYTLKPLALPAMAGVLFVDEPAILFIDELHTLNPTDAGATLLRQLILERKLMGQSINPQVRFVLAGNDSDANASGLDMMETLPHMLANNLVQITLRLPPISEWIEKAKESFLPDIHKSLATFSKYSNQFDEALSPRTLSRVSNVLNTFDNSGLPEAMLIKVLGTVIQDFSGATSKFMASQYTLSKQGPQPLTSIPAKDALAFMVKDVANYPSLESALSMQDPDVMLQIARLIVERVEGMSFIRRAGEALIPANPDKESTENLEVFYWLRSLIRTVTPERWNWAWEKCQHQDSDPFAEKHPSLIELSATYANIIG